MPSDMQVRSAAECARRDALIEDDALFPRRVSHDVKIFVIRFRSPSY